MVPPGDTLYPPLHSDRFDFTDAALETAIHMFTELVYRSS
jgi:hypothetical protein